MCCFRRYNNCGCQKRCCHCYTTCCEDTNPSGSCCGSHNNNSSSCCSSGNSSYRNGYNDGYAAGCQVGYQNGYDAGIANCVMPINGSSPSSGCGCGAQLLCLTANLLRPCFKLSDGNCRRKFLRQFLFPGSFVSIHKLLTFCSNIVHNFSKSGTQTLSILITIEIKYFSQETVIFFS